MTVHSSHLEAAYQSLLQALEPPPKNDRERDGAIQRFEYTFELSWKVGKKVLEELGIQESSPRNVLRELGRQSYIENVPLWMEFLEARNKTSHLYQKHVAEEVFKKVKEFKTECGKFIEKIKNLSEQ